MKTLPLLPTTMVGSYPQPDWLVSREVVAERTRHGLKHILAERIVPAPDCGMKYLARARAFGELRALAEGAAIVRRELMPGA